MLSSLNRVPDVYKIQTNASVASEATVWTPATGQKFRVTGFDLTADTSGLYVFKDNTAGTTIFQTYMVANIPKFVSGINLLSAVAGNVLTCTGIASSHINGTIFGTEDGASVPV